MGWSILIVLVLVLLNGFFAMSELAIVSARRARLEVMARGGSRGAARAIRLGEDPTGFLSTVQVGITLIGIFAGAYSGATLSVPVANALRTIPAVASIAEPLAFGLVVVATTYVSLIIGELVPKRLALRNAEGIAAFVSGPMTILAAVGRPIVWFLKLSTEAVLGLLRLRGEAPSSVTEEEVKAMIAEGTDAGVFHEAERELLEGVIRFADRPLRSIMVPRHAITWIDAEDSLEASLAEVLASGHSRFPLCTGDIDNVVGFVHVKDFLELHLRGGGNLRDVVRDPLYVSESIPALRMIELFRSSGTHIAMVIDEYGSLEGLVTPTDILTGIAGELPDQGEATAASSAVQREDGSWLLDGSLSVDGAARVLGVDGMSSDDYATLAGMIIEELGHLPNPGEYVTLYGWCFEVVDLDGRRIDKVLARRP
jgi:putative hemolysin